MLEESLAAALEPGEVPLAYENATMLTAADRSGKERVQPRLVEGFSPDPVVGGFQEEDGFFDAAISGIGSQGPAGGWGSQIQAALNSEGGALLLTDRRLAVTGGTNARILLSVSRQEIVGMRSAPRILQAGRVEITFRDGSVVRPMLAMLIPRASRRFLSAFETGTPQS